MNDDELSINAELASAYLDGELDGDERAYVAADPDVAAMIESFAQVRAALGEVGPVAESTRDAAVAAALAEFDALHARGSAIAPVTSLQSRRFRAYRVVMGVAAAAVVAVVAVAVLKSTNGNDLKSSSSGTALPAAALPAETPQLKSTADTAAAGATAAPSGAADSSTVQVPAIDTADGLLHFAADFDFATPPAPAATAAAAGTAAPAASVPSVEAATSATASAPPPCLASDQVVLGPIFFQGIPAFAVRVGSTGHIQAIDATDCHLLLDAAP
jgi:negative regulator of sigma E activity